MKTLKTFVMTMTAVALLGSSSLYAQDKAVANIPFAFSILDKTMPAGQYTVQHASIDRPGLIVFQNVADGHSAAVLAPSSAASYSTKDKADAKLIFHRYGDRYFFSEVWSSNGSLCGKAQPTKLERETKSSGSNDQMVAVSISLSVGQ